MTIKKTLLANLTALTLGAQAATISFDGVVNNGPTPATFPTSLSFTVPQFDPSQGTLNSATLTISTTASAEVEADSENGADSTFTANIFGSSTLLEQTLLTLEPLVALAPTLTPQLKQLISFPLLAPAPSQAP